MDQDRRRKGHDKRADRPKVSSPKRGMRRRARRAARGAERVIAGTKPYDEPPLPKRPRNDGQGKLPSAIGAISGARERFRALFHKSAFCDLRKHRSQSGLSAAEATEAYLDRHFKRLFRKEGSRRGRRAFSPISHSLSPNRRFPSRHRETAGYATAPRSASCVLHEINSVACIAPSWHILY